MVILIIGPSGVGKSDYGSHAEKAIPGCRFFDLDDLVSKRSNTPACQLLGKIGDDSFLRCCQREVDELVLFCTSGIAIAAVGAGALQSHHAGSWLTQHPDLTIAVVAPPHEVYRRGGERNRTRSLDAFTKTEYSLYRMSLYKAAKYQCDVTGLSVEDARVSFTELIRNLIDKG